MLLTKNNTDTLELSFMGDVLFLMTFHRRTDSCIEIPLSEDEREREIVS